MILISTLSQNNLNLRIKTEPVTVVADVTVYVWFLQYIHGPDKCKQSPDRHRSRRSRLDLYAELQFILGRESEHALLVWHFTEALWRSAVSSILIQDLPQCMGGGGKPCGGYKYRFKSLYSEPQWYSM